MILTLLVALILLINWLASNLIIYLPLNIFQSLAWLFKYFLILLVIILLASLFAD